MKDIYTTVLALIILVGCVAGGRVINLQRKEISVLRQELSTSDTYLRNKQNYHKYWVNDQDFVDWKNWRRESAEREASR